MLTAVDHIVARAIELETAVDTYRRLGFTTTHIRPSDDDGGVAYAFFGDFHLELREVGPSGSETQGLETLALRTDDIEDEAARLRSIGVPVTDPVVDPIAVGGHSFHRRTAAIDAVIPMRLVERRHTTHELQALLGASEAHPNTTTVLERVYAAVESIDRELGAFERVLGMPAPELEMGTVIMSLMSVFYIGKAGIAVAEPRGAGPTADALAAHGPGLFQVLFRADHLGDAERFMVDHGMPAPARGTRLSGESALLVPPEHACGVYLAMAGKP